MTGILSNVLGGLGVFESVMLVLLGSISGPERLMGALLLYRLIYDLMPLLVALVLPVSFEVGRRTAADPGSI